MCVYISIYMDTKEICYIQDLHKVFRCFHKAWRDKKPQRDISAFSNLRQNLTCPPSASPLKQLHPITEVHQGGNEITLAGIQFLQIACRSTSCCFLFPSYSSWSWLFISPLPPVLAPPGSEDPSGTPA